MKTTITITCASCGKEVSKLASEIKRQTKKGKNKFYCDLKCAGKNKDNIQRVSQFHNNFKLAKYTRQPDEYSNFRWYMKVVIRNSKKRNHEYNVDCEYLKRLWNEQNGICPFTNQKLTLRTHSNNDIKKYPYQASLDRIDSSIGYIESNVRFVALIYNYAKNTFSDDDVINFCKNVCDRLDNGN